MKILHKKNSKWFEVEIDEDHAKSIRQSPENYAVPVQELGKVLEAYRKFGSNTFGATMPGNMVDELFLENVFGVKCS